MIHWLSVSLPAFCRSLHHRGARCNIYLTEVNNQKQTFILIIVHSEPPEHDSFCPFIMSTLCFLSSSAQGSSSHVFKTHATVFWVFFFFLSFSTIQFKWRGIDVWADEVSARSGDVRGVRHGLFSPSLPWISKTWSFWRCATESQLSFTFRVL